MVCNGGCAHLVWEDASAVWGKFDCSLFSVKCFLYYTWSPYVVQRLAFYVIFITS